MERIILCLYFCIFRIDATREMCTLLKNHIARTEDALAVGETDKETFLQLDKQRVDEYQVRHKHADTDKPIDYTKKCLSHCYLYQKEVTMYINGSQAALCVTCVLVEGSVAHTVVMNWMQLWLAQSHVCKRRPEPLTVDASDNTTVLVIE